MTQPRHTPGPWEIIIPEDEDGTLQVGMASYLEDPSMYRSLHLWECGAMLEEGDKGYEEHLANARLIAAAPDLLDACERALAAHPSARSEVGKRLRAAVAKALVPK